VASNTFYVPSGVREGSVLEPLLSNVSVHILPNTIKYSRYLLLTLANDIKMFPNVSSTSDCKPYIQGVTGGTDQTSGECSLDQTIPI